MKPDNQTIHLHPNDNVAIAKIALHPGMDIGVRLSSGEQQKLTITRDIPPGHKVSLKHLRQGDIVRRYGEVIGTASETVTPGEHIHTHNLAIAYSLEEQVLVTQANPVIPVTESEQRTFLGFPRPDGKVGTRNFIAVIANVNCSAFVCRKIAAYFTSERLAPYPNVDGVIALTHEGGCSSPNGRREGGIWGSNKSS